MDRYVLAYEHEMRKWEIIQRAAASADLHKTTSGLEKKRFI